MVTWLKLRETKISKTKTHRPTATCIARQMGIKRGSESEELASAGGKSSASPSPGSESCYSDGSDVRNSDFGVEQCTE